MLKFNVSSCLRLESQLHHTSDAVESILDKLKFTVVGNLFLVFLSFLKDEHIVGFLGDL